MAKPTISEIRKGLRSTIEEAVAEQMRHAKGGPVKPSQIQPAIAFHLGIYCSTVDDKTDLRKALESVKRETAKVAIAVALDEVDRSLAHAIDGSTSKRAGRRKAPLLIAGLA